MTKKENYKIDIDKMFYLVYAVYMDYLAKGKEMPYSQLLSQVETYKMNNTKFDTTIHKIDDFMVDAYRVYAKFANIEDRISEMSEIFKIGKIYIDNDKLKEGFSNIKSGFEELIIHCNFEGAQIRGIQKNFLKEKLKVVIKNEEYEFAAYLRDKIKTI